MTPRVSFERNVITPNKVRPTSPNKVHGISPNNLIFPQGVCVTPAELTAFAERARNASTKPKREPLNFPEPQPAYRRGKTYVTHDGNVQRSPDGSYARDVWAYLQALGFRLLRDLQDAGYAAPDAEALAEVYAEHVTSYGVTHDDISRRDGGGRGSLGISQAFDLAASAAEQTLADFDPEYVTRQRTRGAAGGKSGRPRRATKTTVAKYERFLALREGRTIPQLAARLGISQRSVSRLEARRKADDLSRELDQLFSEISIDENE